MSEAGYLIKLKLNQGKRKNEILINKLRKEEENVL